MLAFRTQICYRVNLTWCPSRNIHWFRNLGESLTGFGEKDQLLFKIAEIFCQDMELLREPMESLSLEFRIGVLDGVFLFGVSKFFVVSKLPCTYVHEQFDSLITALGFPTTLGMSRYQKMQSQRLFNSRLCNIATMFFNERHSTGNEAHTNICGDLLFEIICCEYVGSAAVHSE